MLQVLQSGGVRGRWTLKSPHHAIAPRRAHRRVSGRAAGAPAPRSGRARAPRCAASITHAVGHLQRRRSHGATSPSTGPTMLEESMRPHRRLPRRHPEHPIVDVQYADLVEDPLATVADLYAVCGEELDEAARDGIAAHVDAHPKERAPIGTTSRSSGSTPASSRSGSPGTSIATASSSSLITSPSHRREYLSSAYLSSSTSCSTSVTPSAPASSISTWSTSTAPRTQNRSYSESISETVSCSRDIRVEPARADIVRTVHFGEGIEHRRRGPRSPRAPS